MGDPDGIIVIDMEVAAARFLEKAGLPVADIVLVHLEFLYAPVAAILRPLLAP
jgi:hypothetical protein